jgi:hybrid cluster-associated redox disulfide protein
MRLNVTNKNKDKTMSEKKVTKEMSIIEIVQTYPETIEVFAKNGLGCIGCAAARFENLEAGAKVHGLDPNKLVEEINAAIAQ